MLLNFTWLIPGIPIIVSVFITVLLLSFSKTMNRLTKPVSYIFIISLSFSEIINFTDFFQLHVFYYTKLKLTRLKKSNRMVKY